MSCLELRGVSRSFASGSDVIHALRDVDLKIEQGEFVAIVGPSGGGKTTLLSILGGLDVPTSGSYLLDGEEMPREEGAALAAIRARTFAFVFQGFHLLEQRPAIDSVALGMLYQGVDASERRTRATDAARRVGMESRLVQRTATLSGGQRQRLAIARAIATGSGVLLADEPTGNLDSATGARVMDELIRLNRDGVTVVVVTHSADVASAADRVVRIQDGRLTEDQPSQPRAQSSQWSSRAVPSVGRRSRQGRLFDLVRDAGVSVLSRGRQSAALAATVGLAVALLVTTVGLTDSTSAQVGATFDAHANTEVTASWDDAQTAVDSARALEAAGGIPGTETAAVLTDYAATAVGNLRDQERVVLIHTLAGDLAAAGAEVTGTTDLTAGEALVGAALADQLQLGPLAGGPAITIGGEDYLVRGIITTASRMPMLIGEVVLADAAPLAVAEPSQGRLLLTVHPGAAQSIGAQLPLVLDPYAPASFQVVVPTDPRTLRAEIEGGVQTSLIAFTAVSALIALLTLMNTIGAAVNARRSELGLRRALGARSRQLAGLVLTEAAILGGAGGVAGLIVGMLAILGFTIAQRWVPVFDLRLAPAAVAAGIAVAAIASVLGAVRAARVRPVDALRQGM